MTAFLTSIMFGIGVAGWIGAKVSHRTGGADPKSMFLTAIGAGVVAFVFLFTLMKFVFSID